MRRLLPRALAPLLALACACSDPGPRPAALGEPCQPGGPIAACDAPLVCLDGRCAERPAAPEPERPPLPPLATFDVVTDADDAPDGDDAPDAPDGDDAPDADALDVADAPDVDPDASPPTGTYVLGEHQAEDSPSAVRLGLAPGQAAAREVIVPTPSEGLSVDILVVNATPASACGRFRAIVWIPSVNGFAVPPTEVGEVRELSASAGAPTRGSLPFPRGVAGPLDLPMGPLRVGALYEGPCATAAFAPWIALDDSGLDAGQFVWAQAWIPGATLDLPGRWALSAALRARLP